MADGITMDRFRARDLVVTTKPDLTPVSEADQAVERATARPARGDAARRARRGVRHRDGCTGRRGGRRLEVPVDHRPHRRHQELRARRADLGDADRARTLGRDDRRCRVGARARDALVGGKGLGAFRDGERLGCRRSRRSTTPRSRSPGTPRNAFSRRHRNEARRSLAPVLADARHRRLLAAPARRRRRVRRGDRPDRLAVGHRRDPDHHRGRRTLEHRRRPTDANGESFVCTNGLLHDAVIASLA